MVVGQSWKFARSGVGCSLDYVKIAVSDRLMLSGRGEDIRRVLSAQATCSDVGLASFAHGIIARIEVFALLQLVLQQVLLVWKLAV